MSRTWFFKSAGSRFWFPLLAAGNLSSQQRAAGSGKRLGVDLVLEVSRFPLLAAAIYQVSSRQRAAGNV